MSFKAGILAGSLATIICNPFDIIRVNVQTKGGTSLNSISYIYKKSGINGFYRGIGIGLITIPTFWSFYFPVYEYFKNDLSIPLAAYLAGNFASTITSPLWYIKQKTQTYSELNVVKEIKRLNIFQFYTGLTTTYLINSNFIIQIPIYEYIKTNVDKTTFNIFLTTSLSKIIASTITYPLENIRVLSRHHPTLNLYDIIKIIHVNKSYYRGITNYLLRSIPYHAVVFCTYEYLRH